MILLQIINYWFFKFSLSLSLSVTRFFSSISFFYFISFVFFFFFFFSSSLLPKQAKSSLNWIQCIFSFIFFYLKPFWFCVFVDFDDEKKGKVKISSLLLFSILVGFSRRVTKRKYCINEYYIIPFKGFRLYIYILKTIFFFFFWINFDYILIETKLNNYFVYYIPCFEMNKTIT